ncbi:ABC transporter substrate-binding protein [Brachybacterium sp. AOP43-C2-M15]|uniref:ABC transporter substrate-binding protein n=1 Tax=Brachybacterium sp. AOP43-C2-M15 TaxID=3457661 RepID=UPI0040340843
MEFTRRTGMAALAAAPLLVTMTACNRGGGEGEGLDIALVSKGFQHQFWQAVQQGAEEAAEENGVSITFDGPAAETEVDSQLQMLQAAVDRGPDAICFAALDPEACIPLYQSAESAEIPVVEFDAGCNSDYPQNLAATDNKAAGALAAEHLAEAIGGEGEVGIVGHSQINSTGVDRRDGFVEHLEENNPDIEIVDIQYGDGDHLKSADIAKAMIGAHDLVGLYGTNEGSAIGIVNAVQELGLSGDDIKIVGFDSGSAQQEAIRDGVMLGAVTQDPIAIGRLTVEAAVAVVNGEEVEEFTDTGSYWFDAENIDDGEIQQMIYE